MPLLDFYDQLNQQQSICDGSDGDLIWLVTFFRTCDMLMSDDNDDSDSHSRVLMTTHELTRHNSPTGGAATAPIQSRGSLIKIFMCCAESSRVEAVSLFW